jgi:alpha-tubulin suppressor-like RCC1 family protein
LQCWGRNNSGQLGFGEIEGYGDQSHHPRPLDVVGIPSRIESVVASVVAGHEEFEPKSGEVAHRWAEMAGGYDPGEYYEGHTCAVLDDGTVYCWGGNSEGQLGTGGIAPSGRPRPLASFEFGLFLPICQPIGWR